MFILIVIAALAIVGIVSTVVILPQGQDNKFADRQRNATQYQPNRIF